MLISLRLPLKNGKYSYIEAKVVFNGEVQIHIIDRNKPKSGISILECIEEVQDQILEMLSVSELGAYIHNQCQWILYGKNGQMAKYFNKKLIKLNPSHPVLDQELVMLAFERSKNKEDKTQPIKVMQLAFF